MKTKYDWARDFWSGLGISDCYREHDYFRDKKNTDVYKAMQINWERW